MSMVEVRVPELGDAKGVTVLDVLVKKGGEIRVDDPLITLETEKASMDVPSPVSGVVESIEIKKGDEVSAGALIAMVQATESSATPPADSACRDTACRDTASRGHIATAGRRNCSGACGIARAPGCRRSGGAGCRRRRLYRRVSRGRSWPQGHADRALAGVGRRVFERRLHPVQGAAARGQGDRGGLRHGVRRHRLCASANRPRPPACLEESRRDQIDQRSHAAGEAAQGGSGPRRGEVHRCALGRSAGNERLATHRFQAMHHRRGLRVGAPARLSR